MQKPLTAVPIPPPPADQRVGRGAAFAAQGDKRNRYHLPTGLKSASPVGFRHRVPMTQAQVQSVLPLLSMERPTAFEPVPDPVLEQELFEESALGVLSARQSTNFRGQRQATLGPEHSARIAEILNGLDTEAPVLDHAAYTHICLSRPYRTPFTMLLTFIGHKPLLSMATVPIRGLRKQLFHEDDIPTIGYLQHLHLGIWADALERAVPIASQGRRRAQAFLEPFASQDRLDAHPELIRALEDLAGMTSAERRQGWRVHMVAQVGQVADTMANVTPETWRALGANLLSFRSERIQPGVNAEAKAPPSYQGRQDMDVPEALAIQAGRAAYNAFSHWTRCDRESAKDVLLLERVDVLTDGGKERLRDIRRELGEITDLVVPNIPKWADWPLGKALSRNAAKGKKAFALAGQRIYIGGLDRGQIEALGIDWNQAVRACGAAASRSALTCELAGVTDLPPGCDLLAGICLMAGPVNQNDIGKKFFGYKDLLSGAWPDRDPTSLLVWTLKAKTVADPIGNEEQLLNPERKGALVDLRAGPHDVVSVHAGGALAPMRQRDGQVNRERAFADVGNFATDAAGTHIPGNPGHTWEWGQDPVW
jgi:hypothetical protein